jgi:translation initiation factor eIF-2B subunit beta
MSVAFASRSCGTDLQTAIRSFEIRARNHRRALSSASVAQQTLTILRRCVDESRTTEELESQVIRICTRFQSSIPGDVLPGNLATAVLAFLNAELNAPAQRSQGDVQRSQSLGLLEIFVMPSLLSRSFSNLRDHAELCHRVNRKIASLEEGIDAAGRALPKRAKEYVHDDDVVMTIGYSATVLGFFVGARRRRRFAVLVPEHAPQYDGFVMADALERAGIESAVIPDAAVFAVMPRVTAVFAGVRGVFADGTIVTTSYGKAVALAARHHAKPFIALYWSQKLTNRFIKPRDSFTVLGSPDDIVPIDDVVAKCATVLNPDGEMIGPSVVTLLINEDGPHGPEKIFPLVQEKCPPRVNSI